MLTNVCPSFAASDPSDQRTADPVGSGKFGIRSEATRRGSYGANVVIAQTGAAHLLPARLALRVQVSGVKITAQDAFWVCLGPMTAAASKAIRIEACAVPITRSISPFAMTVPVVVAGGMIAAQPEMAGICTRRIVTDGAVVQYPSPISDCAVSELPHHAVGENVPPRKLAVPICLLWALPKPAPRYGSIRQVGPESLDLSGRILTSHRESSKRSRGASPPAGNDCAGASRVNFTMWSTLIVTPDRRLA